MIKGRNCEQSDEIIENFEELVTQPWKGNLSIQTRLLARSPDASQSQGTGCTSQTREARDVPRRLITNTSTIWLTLYTCIVVSMRGCDTCVQDDSDV